MSKQGSKAKANLPAGGFVALGRDGPSSSFDSSSRLRAHISGKRELAQASGGVLKKPRLEILSKGAPGASMPLMKRYEHDETKWRQFCSEVTVEPKQLLSLLISAFDKQKAQKAARLLCAAIRECINYRRETNVWAGEPLILSSILTFCKEHSAFLMHEDVLNALCSLLLVALPNPSPAISAAPILIYSILKESEEWPWTLVECFVDDSLHERCWVDRICAAALVDNIITAFGTTAPSEELYNACELTYPERFQHKQAVRDRFAELANKSSKVDAVIAHIIEVCERKSEGAPRNLLKTMSACAGCAQVRLLATQKMDSWLLSGKLQRHAMELLLWVACNVRSVVSAEDIETLGALLKLRALKSKQINNLFNVALKEILSHDNDFMGTIMKLLLANEFSSNRFPYNMMMIHSLFSFDNASASQVLAGELCQMLAAKEEYLRVSRTFLREFVRALLRVDFDVALFAHYLFQTLTDKYVPTSVPAHLFKSLMELCWMLPFLAVTPIVREGTQLRRNANVTLSQAHVDALLRFYTEVRKFFEECVEFLVSHHAYCTDSRLFVYSFYRLLYLAPADYYSSVDNWPLEADVTQFMRAIADAPLSEALLLRILKAGAEQSVPIDAADAIDLVENLTKRASISSPLNDSVVSMIQIDDCETINTLFATTVYRPPTTFQLQESELPALSVRTLYWKAWIIAVMWASLNKHSLIKEAYVKFPTLKVAIQIVLTWDYRFPPLASAGDAQGAERMILDDERELNEEKQKIRKLEARLAGTDVDDADSKLLGKLCSLSPSGICRRLPDTFLRDLEKLNEDLDLSGSLSECREPDLLADIIRSQGSACALPSIMNLVESNANAILYLPLECICELFLHYLLTSTSPLTNSKKPSNDKLNALRQRLRDSLRGPTANENTVMETLQYLATRLGAHSPVERSAAAHALTLFLQPDANGPILPVNVDASPTGFLHMVNCFDSLRGRICGLLAQLCPVETKSARLTEYIDFLIEYADASTSHLVAHHISSVVERLTDVREEEAVHSSALRFFDKYVRNACKSESTWTPALVHLLPVDAKKINVEFFVSQKEKICAEMVSSSVGAILQLLCTQHGDQGSAAHTDLMDLFFPAHGRRPKVTNAEEIELLPSWLKLKMLCAEDERIVNVALGDMKQEDALKFVQSFGLTSYSCCKLFAMLDKANFEFEGDVLCEARNAAPFIRAYKRRGAVGADKFLARLSERLSRNKALKMEVDNEEIVHIALKEAPSLSDVHRNGEATKQSLNTQQVVQYIDMAISQNNIEDDSNWFRALAEMMQSVECAHAVMALLKKKPSLLNNSTAVLPVLTTVGVMREKSAQLKNDLHSLSQFVAKKSNICDTVKAILKKFDGQVPTQRTKSQQRPISTLSAEDILVILGDSSSSTEYDASALINRFLCVCPELVPRSGAETDNAKRHEMLWLLFGARSRNLEYIISLMPTRCSPQTISLIIGSILDSHSPSISSGSVLAAVMNSLSLAHPDPLTYARRVVLADYIIDEVDYNASALPTIVKFIDESAPSRVEMVNSLFSAFSDVLSSSATPTHRRQVVISIIKEFSVRYPEVRIEDSRVKLRWLRSLSGEDRIAHELIMNMFSSANASSLSVPRYISLLRQLARAQPPVIIRHLSLIGSLLLSVGCLPMRQLKAKYKSVLVFVLDVLLRVTPDAFKEALQVETIIGSYLRIFDGIGRSRFWAPLVLKFQKVCVRYVEFNGGRARAFFVSHSEVIRQLVNTHESSAANILSDVITLSAHRNDE